jgi:hypothetical protein
MKIFFTLIFLQKKNQVHYTIKPKWIILTILIPSLNIHIDKYYFGSYYHSYVNNKFNKKIKENEIQEKIKIDF